MLPASGTFENYAGTTENHLYTRKIHSVNRQALRHAARARSYIHPLHTALTSNSLASSHHLHSHSPLHWHCCPASHTQPPCPWTALHGAAQDLKLVVQGPNCCPPQTATPNPSTPPQLTVGWEGCMLEPALREITEVPEESHQPNTLFGLA